jgi:hypothetical protein
LNLSSGGGILRPTTVGAPLRKSLAPTSGSLLGAGKAEPSGAVL